VFENRIFRCGAADYYGDEILDTNRTHTDRRLKAITEAGFNGIWLHGCLRDLVPTTLFAPFVKKSRERLTALARLVNRARRCGLGVWLYFNEPLGLAEDHPFWKKNPHLKGHRTPLDPMEGHTISGPGMIHMCSSTPEIQRFLEDGFYTLFRQANPAGVILITASEHPHHCWSHALTNPRHPCPDAFWPKKISCPRCTRQGPVNVITDIINRIHAGVKAARPQAQVVAWDWDWNMYENPPYRKIINRLSEDIVLMGDFERGTKIRRLGKTRVVEEYSLVVPGPSPRFKAKVNFVGSRRKIWAKLQINTTHELATVPNLPLPVSLYRKFKYLRQAKASGYMATWNFGCAPDTLNAFAVKKLSAGKIPSERKWLRELATDYFGPGADAEKIVECWYAFQRAGRYFPHSGKLLLYFTPINYALAYPLKTRFENKPMGPSWRKHVFGDRLEDHTETYTFSQLVELLGKLSTAWQTAVDAYDQALTCADNLLHKNKELGVARVIACNYRSLYHIYRWYGSVKIKKEKPLNPSNVNILRDEIDNLRQALPWIDADRRLGFHGEAQTYMFESRIINHKLRMLVNRIKPANL
jgi:hypothetical protein